MRLSRAFFVVLVLHVVAVGGIFLFNKIQLESHKSEATQTQPIAPDVTAAVPATPAQQAAAATERRHFLRSGERLADVAAKYRVSLAELQEANGFKHSSDAVVGQSLIIPSVSAPAQSVKAATAPPAAADLRRIVGSAPAVPPHPPRVQSAPSVASRGTTYVVEKGDNPHAIAREHGVDYHELIKINNITDPKLLQIGQVLTIPPKK